MRSGLGLLTAGECGNVGVRLLVCFTLWLLLIGKADGHPGREFVVGFLQNRPITVRPVGRIYISTLSLRRVTVTISIPGTEYGRFWPRTEAEEASGYFGPYQKRFTVTALEPIMHEIPTEIHFEGVNLEEKGVLITSTADITVQVASVNDQSSDLYLALPVTALDTEYYVMSTLYRGVSKFPQGPSEFAVVAVVDNTDVTITLPDKTEISDTVGHDIEYNGRTLTVTLDAYQTIQVRSRNDLTGSRVQGSDKVVVLSGSEWSSVGSQEVFGDYMIEQLPPYSAWSNMYLTAPLATMTAGDSYRILSARDDTNINITWYGGYRPRNRTIMLHEGYFYDLKASNTEYIHVQSSSPVLMAQFCNSLGSDASTPGDPFMSLVQPMSQYYHHYTFWAMTSYFASETYDNYVNVLIQGDADPGDLLLDGKYLTDDDIYQDWQKIRSSNFWVITLRVDSGGHRLSQKDDTPFGASVYGFLEREGYGAPIGLISVEPWEEAELVWQWAIATATSTTPRIPTESSTVTTRKQDIASTNSIQASSTAISSQFSSSSGPVTHTTPHDLVIPTQPNQELSVPPVTIDDSRNSTDTNIESSTSVSVSTTVGSNPNSGNTGSSKLQTESTIGTATGSHHISTSPTSTDTDNASAHKTTTHLPSQNSDITASSDIIPDTIESVTDTFFDGSYSNDPSYVTQLPLSSKSDSDATLGPKSPPNFLSETSARATTTAFKIMTDIVCLENVTSVNAKETENSTNSSCLLWGVVNSTSPYVPSSMTITNEQMTTDSYDTESHESSISINMTEPVTVLPQNRTQTMRVSASVSDSASPSKSPSVATESATNDRNGVVTSGDITTAAIGSITEDITDAMTNVDNMTDGTGSTLLTSTLRVTSTKSSDISLTASSLTPSGTSTYLESTGSMEIDSSAFSAIETTSSSAIQDGTIDIGVTTTTATKPTTPTSFSKSSPSHEVTHPDLHTTTTMISEEPSTLGEGMGEIITTSSEDPTIISTTFQTSTLPTTTTTAIIPTSTQSTPSTTASSTKMSTQSSTTTTTTSTTTSTTIKTSTSIATSSTRKSTTSLITTPSRSTTSSVLPSQSTSNSATGSSTSSATEGDNSFLTAEAPMAPGTAAASSEEQEKSGIKLEVILIPICVVILCPLLCIFCCYLYGFCARRVHKKHTKRTQQQEQVRMDLRNKYAYRPPKEEQKVKRYKDPEVGLASLAPVQTESIPSVSALETCHFIDDNDTLPLVHKAPPLRKGARSSSSLFTGLADHTNQKQIESKASPRTQVKVTCAPDSVSSKPPKPPLKRTQSNVSYKQAHPVPHVKRLPSARLKSRAEAIKIKEGAEDVSQQTNIEKTSKRIKTKRKMKKTNKVNVFKCHQIPVPPQTDSSSSGYHSGGVPQSQTGSSSNLDSSHHSDSLPINKPISKDSPLLTSSPRQHMVAWQLNKSMQTNSSNKIHPIDCHTVSDTVTVLNGKNKKLARIQTANDTQGYEASEEDCAI